MEVAVIGGGVMGLSSARSLAARGHAVTVFEQFEPGHTHGSSHGRSRIVRIAYPDPFYAGIMVEGLPLWRKLQAESTDRFLYESGLLYFGPEQHPDIVDVARTLAALDVEHTTQSQSYGIHLKDGETAIFSREGGWVDAGVASQCFWRLANAAGAERIMARVDRLDSLRPKFDRVVVCAGAWVRDFADWPVQVEAHTLAYVAGFRDGPVWIDASDSMIYGFPSEPGTRTFKVGVHLCGVEADPNDRVREPDAHTLKLVLEFARD